MWNGIKKIQDSIFNQTRRRNCEYDENIEDNVEEINSNEIHFEVVKTILYIDTLEEIY